MAIVDPAVLAWSVIPIGLFGWSFILYQRHWLKKVARGDSRRITWWKGNAESYAVRFTLPGMLLFAPMIEEMMFRSILIVLFPSFTDAAFVGIAVMAILFGLMHLTNDRFGPDDVIAWRELGHARSDWIAHEVRRMNKAFPRIVRGRHLFQVGKCTLSGLLYGALAVWSGSLWLCVLAHFISNLLVLVLGLVRITRIRRSGPLPERYGREWAKLRLAPYFASTCR